MNDRHGTVSSSGIWKLLTKDRSGKAMGKQGTTYIKQIQYEQKLGRPLNAERDSRPTTWGRLTERQAFEVLDLSYQLVSKERLFHPDMPYWSGMPDVKKPLITGDIKCPYSLEVFCDKISALSTSIEEYKKLFPEDYWQHISSAVLLEANGHPVTHFEPIIYCPYQSHLAMIRLMAYNSIGEDQYRYRWIASSTDEEVPYLLDNGTYKDLNIFRFEVPQEDKNLLIELMHGLKPQLGKLPVIIAEHDRQVNATIISHLK